MSRGGGNYERERELWLEFVNNILQGEVITDISHPKTTANVADQTARLADEMLAEYYHRFDN